MPGFPARSRCTFRDQTHLFYIATVRKDGNQSNAAPVWFTVTPDRLLLIQTKPTTWKARRIRRNSPVIVWIGKRDGLAFIGKAEIATIRWWNRE
jgi:hypothetical protein